MKIQNLYRTENAAVFILRALIAVFMGLATIITTIIFLPFIAYELFASHKEQIIQALGVAFIMALFIVAMIGLTILRAVE